MTPMLLGASEAEAIARVRAYAESFPIELGRMRLIASGHVAAPSTIDPNFSCAIPVGFRASFTVERHPEPVGWCRHFSMSAARRDRLPHPLAAQSVMTLFGMEGAYEDCLVYIEDFAGGAALNVVEKIRGVPPHLGPEH